MSVAPLLESEMLDDDPFVAEEQMALDELSEAVIDEEAERVRPQLPVLHEIIDELAQQVSQRQCVGLVAVDTGNLESWERRHGAASFTSLMGRLSRAAEMARGDAVRDEDRVCLDMPGGDTVLLFLSHPRQEETEVAAMIDLEEAMARFKNCLLRPFKTAQMSFHQALEKVSLGSALLLHNSSVEPRREIYRAIRRARADAKVNYHEMQRRRHRVVGHMIAHRKIRTMYQPIVELPSRNIMGFEALSRAEPRDAKELGVHLFVAASRAELDGELDQTCRTLSVHRRPGLADRTKLFINCLPPTFFEPHNELDQLIDKWLEDGLQPQQLVFEITEQISGEQAMRIMPTVARLRDRGFLFALDDVGTGSSNLKLLADLEPDYIKMDITLTTGIAESERKRELAGYLLELARKSKAKLIAEGIETEAELATLVELGVHFGQGYLLGRPNPPQHWLG